MGTLTLRTERQSAQMSKITNDGLTRPGIGCFVAVPMWHHWASKGFKNRLDVCNEWCIQSWWSFL